MSEEWHRVVLACPCPEEFGQVLAADIEQDFRQNYPHEHDVTCIYEAGRLLLSSTNDYDPDGLNLSDEFSDLITAYAPDTFDGDIVLVSSQRVSSSLK